VGGRIRPCCNHADHLVARSVKRIVVGQIAGPNDLDARVGQTALGELFGKNAGLRAGEINEGRIRIDVAYPLQEWGKIRISKRDANRLDDLPPCLDETGSESSLCFNPWRPNR
jgi:hypothetical protein